VTAAKKRPKKFIKKTSCQASKISASVAFLRQTTKIWRCLLQVTAAAGRTLGQFKNILEIFTVLCTSKNFAIYAMNCFFIHPTRFRNTF
jgi:hypothetical protein